MKCSDTQNEAAIRNFRDYLRIKTAHPHINFGKCISFLRSIADELGLECQILTFVPCKPIILMTWIGLDICEPSILLNSHVDVVPVVEDNWNHFPFGAERDVEGNIYGRGAQDMKCVPIMYLEAIRRFICKGTRFKRTFHLTFMPDEEIGGKDGMGTFVTTSEFKKLNIGFALDEGCVTPFKFYPVFYGENICWQIMVHCRGKSGHSASLQSDTAGEKLRIILNKFMDYRDKMQEKNASSTENISTESITSLNLTKISGGTQVNVLPDEITATFDVRLSINEDLHCFEQMLNQWCCVAGPGVSLEFILKEKKRPETSVNCSNPFWEGMSVAAQKLNINLLPMIMPGMTDSRYIRELNIPALGFTPINETPILIHGDDEYINENKLLEGINIYMEIFEHIGNV